VPTGRGFNSAVARKRLGALLCGTLGLAVVAVGLSSPTYARTLRLKVPGQPTGVTARSIDQGAVVSWGPPASDGGSAITGYSVKVGAGTRAVGCTTTAATTCTVTGLTDGRQYQARVRAINGVGQGKISRSGKFTPGQSPNCANLVPGANLEFCDFHNADLAGLNLAGADFFGAKLVGANFGGADLEAASFGGNTQAQSDLTEVDFSNANLTDANFSGMYMYLTAFVGANLTDASFEGGTLLADNFTTANLTGVDLATVLVEFPIWSDTTCPDGTNSNNDGGSC
jgi:hypothetical protein